MSETNPTALGILTPSELDKLSQAAIPYLVQDLLVQGSTNILVGHSNLGKSPLAVSLGVAVASGQRWLGREVRQGRVLYIDFENSPHSFSRMLKSLSKHAGLAGPPEDFYSFSPWWDIRSDSMGANSSKDELKDRLRELRERVAAVRPTLVIIDPLRPFSPDAVSKAEVAQALHTGLRDIIKSTGVGTAVLLAHHRRKTAAGVETADLSSDPHAVAEESVGTLALVNGADSRLFVEKDKDNTDYLVLGGFIRGYGPIEALQIVRDYDSNGDPIGYSRLTGIEHLKPKQRTAFEALPTTFGFSDAKRELGGKSGDAAQRFLSRIVDLGLARQIGFEARGKRYVKLEHPVIAAQDQLEERKAA